VKSDQKEGSKEQIKGWTDSAIGTVTGSEDRKVKGDIEITDGANRKDYGDQKGQHRKVRSVEKSRGQRFVQL